MMLKKNKSIVLKASFDKRKKRTKFKLKTIKSIFSMRGRGAAAPFKPPILR